MSEKSVQEKGQENIAIIADKVKVVEAEIETHRVALHDAKMRLKKLHTLDKQLTALLAVN